ncbi:hypothetical protein HS041_20360 [Planomonospora sp. ID67723]|nr:hypothetical protein [Planomonospora sp. ID67723]MBG0830122.1 hypothetical protein [Planomonospora sp. ID67723]
MDDGMTGERTPEEVVAMLVSAVVTDQVITVRRTDPVRQAVRVGRPAG